MSHDKIPSPCIDICKDRHGVCIACGRSDADKRAWKKAETREEKLRLLVKCVGETEAIGTRVFWEREYRRRCRKKGAACALDEMVSGDEPVEALAQAASTEVSSAPHAPGVSAAVTVVLRPTSI